MTASQHNYLKKRIIWQETPNPEYPYSARIDLDDYLIRLNDFPAESLYTLIINNKEVEDLDDWPEQWIRSSDMQDDEATPEEMMLGSGRRLFVSLEGSFAAEACSILFLPSNPIGMNALQVKEEAECIKSKLKLSGLRDRFNIECRWIADMGDMQRELLKHKPDILHFSGHGSALNAITLGDKLGNRGSVSDQDLEQLFSNLSTNIRIVILNACYSAQQAQTIAKHVECVVAMPKPIPDLTATQFVVRFYNSLAFGQDVETAFNLGCAEIEMEGYKDLSSLKLLTKKSNPRHTIFQLSGRQRISHQPGHSIAANKQVQIKNRSNLKTQKKKRRK